MRSKIFSIIILLCFQINASAQLKPGFDWQEYHDMFILCIKNFYKHEASILPDPAPYHLVYESPYIGLDNKWQLYVHNDQPLAAISLRGTTASAESWLANFYSAMIPARGTIRLNKERRYDYSFAVHPNAAVHAGWALCALALSDDILPKMDSLYRAGIKDFYITGHSQGGALSTLLTAYLKELQAAGKLPADIQIKNYASASPKVGNEYFAHEYKIKTADFGAFNVVNVEDWVPQTFITVQKPEDYNAVSIFQNFQNGAVNGSIIQRLLMKTLYKKVKKPLNKAQKRFEKYFGKYIHKQIIKYLPELEMPAYFHSSHYIAAPHVIPMIGELRQNTDGLPLMHFHNASSYYNLILQNLKSP